MLVLFLGVVCVTLDDLLDGGTGIFEEVGGLLIGEEDEEEPVGVSDDRSSAT